MISGFIIRTCTTLLGSLTMSAINLTNDETTRPQQCYAGTFTDPIANVPQSAYFCYCNDKSGCNSSKKLLSNRYTLILLLFMIYWLKLAAAAAATTA